MPQYPPTTPHRWILACLLWLTGLLSLAWAPPAAAQTLRIEEATAVSSAADRFPEQEATRVVSLPDDWAETWPHHDGIVWYRVRFDLPAGAPADDLLALYADRVCSNFEVMLNGRRIHRSGNLNEPISRHCADPQLVSLPTALLQTHNVVDLRVQGSALQRVSARQHAGGLSAVQIGRLQELTSLQASHAFWSVTSVQMVGATLLVLGGFMLALYAMNRGEVYLLYFGALLVAWSLRSAGGWWRDYPVDTGTVEFLLCAMFPLIAACAIQFLLSYAGLRSRPAEAALLLQCLLAPASLLIAGRWHLFAAACAWYALLIAETLAAMGVYLRTTRRKRPQDFLPMAVILSGLALLVLYELAIQLRLSPRLGFPWLHFAVPVLLFAIGARLLQLFARALKTAEATRNSLEDRVREATAEIERNFAQLSELRVEQVTEKERKRIAADLHDDLGAKLLTIVHTSESERISTLAREALEEMRLSVRGLTGKPVRLADALADWRAEIVSRLGQANIEADWRGPPEDVDHLLPARAYVQTTRILREAISNIIKHSGASHCKVRTSVRERDFGVLVQDNGRGIPLELDGKLDRGHGMSSMKHRAKQLQGQCLVESGPGYGTVIRLTLPL